MFKQILYDGFTKMSPYEVHRVVTFLFENQGKCVIGKNDITSAIEYAMKDRPSFGGYVITMENEEGKIVAATVVNKTGMAGYGPENILVYFATQENSRNYEACRKLLDKTIKVAKEDIAFLVTPDNPWKAIFRKLGFESKLLEMKYRKPNRKSIAS
ncbi:MAG TPA: GNAT family N-acetyltransferase [Phaeodactylibacter sp.]|nr:GNAT family N-acetyltransferase [Phaeodactylibacter sp.]